MPGRDDAPLRARFYPAGAELIRQGSRTGSLYILKNGEVEVIRDDHLLSVMRLPGTIMGEMSILLDRPHTATVRARTDVEMFVLADAMRELGSHPSWLMQIARVLAHHLDAATVELMKLPKPQRPDAMVLPGLMSAMSEDTERR